MSPHLISAKQDRFNLFTPSDVKNDWNTLFGGAYDRETVANNYDNGVTQADAVIKDLFGALEAKGYLNNSVVVVTSDHGSLVAQADRLLALDETGHLRLIRATPKAFELIDETIVGEGEAWAHLAVADGELFVRDGAGINAYRWR